jgi:hypothetical protein
MRKEEENRSEIGERERRRRIEKREQDMKMNHLPHLKVEKERK